MLNHCLTMNTWMCCLFFSPGTTAQRPLQHLGLLAEKAQQRLTGGGANRLERSRGLGSAPPLLIDTSLSSLRKPHPLPSIHKNSGSGLGSPVPRSPNTHTHNTHTQTFPTNQTLVFAMGGPRGSGFRHWWLANLVEPMRCNCFLRKCASFVRTGAILAYAHTHIHTHTQRHTLFCFRADCGRYFNDKHCNTHTHTHHIMNVLYAFGKHHFSSFTLTGMPQVI